VPNKQSSTASGNKF